MKKLTVSQWVLFSLAAVCLVLGAFFQFCMIGYTTTALVLLGVAACCVFYGLLAPRRAAGARRLRFAMTILLIIGLICFLAAEIPVLLHARSDEDTSAPYLIVCGAGVNGSVPSRSLTDRLREAAVWLEDNPQGMAVLSGAQGRGEDLTEAQAMFLWLTERGVDPDRLLLEEHAFSSYENIANSLDLIAARDGAAPEHVAILSAEYHLYRLSRMAADLGCRASLVAARTTKVSLFVNYAIREAFAMWKLWIFGP